MCKSSVPEEVNTVVGEIRFNVRRICIYKIYWLNDRTRRNFSLIFFFFFDFLSFRGLSKDFDKTYLIILHARDVL